MLRYLRKPNIYKHLGRGIFTALTEFVGAQILCSNRFVARASEKSATSKRASEVAPRGYVPIPRLRVGLGVSRRCGRLSLKRCDRSHTDRSNPTRAGPCPYGTLDSNSPSGGVCSQRLLLTEGPGRESSGGVTFRLRRGAKVPSLMKHSGIAVDSSAATRHGWSQRSAEVSGGFAWAQWWTTLTGESPTSSLRGKPDL